MAGATGMVGKALLQQLLADEYYRTIITVTRRELGFTHEKLVQVVVPFDELAEVAQLLEVTDVYCCLGTTMKKAGGKEQFRQVDYDYVLGLAELTKQQGCENFYLVSSIGANPKSMFFYTRVKGEVEEALKGVGFQGLHIFRPASLTGDRQENRPGERFGLWFLRVFNFALVGGLKKYRPITDEQVAKGMRMIAHQAKSGVHTYESDQIQAL